MGETSLGGLSDGCAFFFFFKRFQVVERVLDCVPAIKITALLQV